MNQPLSRVRSAHGAGKWRGEDGTNAKPHPRRSLVAPVAWSGVAAAVLVMLAYGFGELGQSSLDDSRGRPAAERRDRPAAGSGSMPRSSEREPTASSAHTRAVAPVATPPSEWEADFKAARARFDELRWFADDKTSLLAEARQANEQLPALVARKTVEPGNALLLEADLIEVLESDDGRRREQLVAWWSEHPLARPLHPVTGYRYDEALKRERALVLDWQTQPSVDRDVRDLEQQLRRIWQSDR